MATTSALGTPDSILAQEGTLQGVHTEAATRGVAWQLGQEMERQVNSKKHHVRADQNGLVPY
jgi:hypothetical protein